uniref:Uncharacterized protein n=1 Tax=Periophthalmus magnuspinnatus TaxID=409849 RepID=A0A3B4AJR3_9GOBI
VLTIHQINFLCHYPRSLDPLPMHGRDVGLTPDDLMEPPEPEQEAKQEILENKDISDVFQAKNLIDVMKRAHVARQKLLRLGVFKDVEVLIDTSEGKASL